MKWDTNKSSQNGLERDALLNVMCFRLYNIADLQILFWD